MNTPTLSIVIPVFNEQEAITELFSALAKLEKSFPTDIEVILVDDGSTDHTLEKIKSLDLPYKKQTISLSRNFGHQAALVAGLEASSGEIVVTMDGDLQHPPALIPEMLKQHAEGVDIVFTRRIDTNAISLEKKMTSGMFYSLINRFSGTKIERNGSDFRSLNRKALTALLSMPEKRKFLRGMVSWIGFKTIVLPFTVQERAAGKSKYTLFKMMRLALSGITSFSTFPLYLSAFFGAGLFIAAVIYALYVLYIRFFAGGIVQGWASVLFVLLIVGGFLSLFIGVIGLYVAAIYDEVKNRPIYFIKEVNG